MEAYTCIKRKVCNGAGWKKRVGLTNDFRLYVQHQKNNF